MNLFCLILISDLWNKTMKTFLFFNAPEKTRHHKDKIKHMVYENIFVSSIDLKVLVGAYLNGITNTFTSGIFEERK